VWIYAKIYPYSPDMSYYCLLYVHHIKEILWLR
jgi:hypothetical protein